MEQRVIVNSFQFHAALALATASALGGCAAKGDAATGAVEHEPAPALEEADGSVQVSPASRAYVVAKPVTLDATVPVVRAPARIAFRDGAVSQVSMPVAGRVTAVMVSTGDHVKAGDPLVTLSSPDAAAARASATAAAAEVDAAKREVERQDKMAASGVGIESDRVVAQAHLRELQAELARAQSTSAILGSGGGSTVVLRAPIEGTVITRRATVGSVAEPGGDALIELGNPTAVWAVADVFERDLAQVNVGADVDIELSGRTTAIHGKVVSIGSALTGSMRTAPVYIGLTDAPADLRAGMFARASVKAPAGKSIVLPAESVLIKDGKELNVFVKIGEDRYAARAVTVGPSVDGQVQVLTGLKVGEQVVIKGALLLDAESEQLQ